MSEDKPQPQIVGLPLIDGSAVTFSPSIEALLSHHLWYTWAGLALEHEAAAWAAREASLNQDPRDRDTGPEMREGLPAITSAAFALDGWFGDTMPVLCGRTRGRLQAHKHLLESLRLATSDAGVRSPEYNSEINWLFEWGGVRGHAVHHEPRSTEGLQHPAMIDGTLSSAEQVIYSAGAATRAIVILGGVVRACLDHPTARLLSPWHENNQGILDQLAASLDSRPEWVSLRVDWQ